MLRAARALGTPLGPRPSLLPAGAAFSVLGVKDAAVAAASKLVEEVKGSMEGATSGAVPSAPEEGPQAVGPAESGTGGAGGAAGRHEVPASDHGERLFAGGADVGPEERASTAGSPFAFEGEKTAAGGLATEGEAVPSLEGLEQTFAGGIEDRDDQEEVLRPGHLRTFRDTDPAEAARVPEQPSGLEAEFEDDSFRGV